jgi:archaellum component FlaC
MAFYPKIAGIVAQLVGNIQGKVTSQVQTEVLKILGKFSNQCPPSKEIARILKIRNTLLKNIGSLSKRINALKSMANKLSAAITAAKVIIRLLKATPLPTTIGTPPGPTGGVIFSVTVGKVITVGDRLSTINKLLDSLEADKAGILGVINSASSTLENLRNRLSAIDLAVEECSKESLDLSGILATAQPKSNVGIEGPPIDPVTGELDPKYSYKGYTLAIVQDPNSPEIAPRRFAVAKDRRGIVVLKGQPSFSSSVDVLLDEIKFRIDNQLA